MGKKEKKHKEDHLHDCDVKGRTESELSAKEVKPTTPCSNPVIKVPVLLAETELQIVVESKIPLDPPASEIKHVDKDVVIKQCKLVPVEFKDKPVKHSHLFEAKRAKLFVEGFIRKNIQYATDKCKGTIRDRIANVSFSGFADLKKKDFICFPVFAKSTDSKSRFINPDNSSEPRFDKFLFNNHVFYNEQPFCELVQAKFAELDFSPHPTKIGKTFDKIRKKIVLDLTVKVLQNQQVKLNNHKHKHKKK